MLFTILHIHETITTRKGDNCDALQLEAAKPPCQSLSALIKSTIMYQPTFTTSVTSFRQTQFLLGHGYFDEWWEFSM